MRRFVLSGKKRGNNSVHGSADDGVSYRERQDIEREHKASVKRWLMTGIIIIVVVAIILPVGLSLMDVLN